MSGEKEKTLGELAEIYKQQQRVLAASLAEAQLLSAWILEDAAVGKRVPDQIIAVAWLVKSVKGEDEIPENILAVPVGDLVTPEILRRLTIDPHELIELLLTMWGGDNTQEERIEPEEAPAEGESVDDVIPVRDPDPVVRTEYQISQEERGQLYNDIIHWVRAKRLKTNKKSPSHAVLKKEIESLYNGSSSDFHNAIMAFQKTNGGSWRTFEKKDMRDIGNVTTRAVYIPTAHATKFLFWVGEYRPERLNRDALLRYKNRVLPSNNDEHAMHNDIEVDVVTEQLIATWIASHTLMTRSNIKVISTHDYYSLFENPKMGDNFYFRNKKKVKDLQEYEVRELKENPDNLVLFAKVADVESMRKLVKLGWRKGFITAKSFEVTLLPTLDVSEHIQLMKDVETWIKRALAASESAGGIAGVRVLDLMRLIGNENGDVDTLFKRFANQKEIYDYDYTVPLSDEASNSSGLYYNPEFVYEFLDWHFQNFPRGFDEQALVGYYFLEKKIAQEVEPTPEESAQMYLDTILAWYHNERYGVGLTEQEATLLTTLIAERWGALTTEWESQRLISLKKLIRLMGAKNSITFLNAGKFLRDQRENNLLIAYKDPIHNEDFLFSVENLLTVLKEVFKLSRNSLNTAHIHDQLAQ